MIATGDMNAAIRVGREENLEGAFDLGTGNNEERLSVQLCTRDQVCIMKTWHKNLEKQEVHKEISRRVKQY